MRALPMILALAASYDGFVLVQAMPIVTSMLSILETAQAQAAHKAAAATGTPPDSRYQQSRNVLEPRTRGEGGISKLVEEIFEVASPKTEEPARNALNQPLPGHISNTQPRDSEETLAAFRAEWQRELSLRFNRDQASALRLHSQAGRSLDSQAAVPSTRAGRTHASTEWEVPNAAAASSLRSHVPETETNDQVVPTWQS